MTRNRNTLENTKIKIHKMNDMSGDLCVVKFGSHCR